jgi:hypothetical protein
MALARITRLWDFSPLSGHQKDIDPMITRRQFSIGTGAGILGGLLGVSGRLGTAEAFPGTLQQDTARIEAAVKARLLIRRSPHRP